MSEKSNIQHQPIAPQPTTTVADPVSFPAPQPAPLPQKHSHSAGLEEIRDPLGNFSEQVGSYFG